jgi:hypothetical protein
MSNLQPPQRGIRLIAFFMRNICVYDPPAKKKKMLKRESEMKLIIRNPFLSTISRRITIISSLLEKREPFLLLRSLSSSITIEAVVTATNQYATLQPQLRS